MKLWKYWERLCVIADSITAGLNDGEITWPRLFAERTGVKVLDASQPGATLRSALKQAEALNDDQTPLMLEIGGNDLLSGVTLAEFSRDCEQLCQKVCAPGRVVWMCELPLPPGKSQFGAAQRRIARKYGVRLVPKRKVMRLLTAKGATVDSIHLSPTGQELFCELIQNATGCVSREVENVRYKRIERRYNASALRR
jgi:acyl-CoA thioesterase-1